MSSAVVGLARCADRPTGDLEGLRRFVSDHPLARYVRGNVACWTTGDGGLAEYVTPDTGALEGRCFRDLGDVTPYLWLLGDQASIDGFHGAAESETRDGLLVQDRRIRSFDNHDYVLSFYLLWRLTGEDRWRDDFLERCGQIRDRFFDGRFPPESVGTGGGSFKGSAFTYGLLELFALAHRCDPQSRWLDVVAGELETIERTLSRQALPVMPRAALRLGGRTVFDPRPGALFARLFKDNSNLAYALLAYQEASDDPRAGQLLRRLVAGLGELFLSDPDGWVRTESNLRGGKLHATRPLLIGNAVAIDLVLAGDACSFLGGLFTVEDVRRWIEAPLATRDERGLLVEGPDATRQHLDMTTDFVTAAVTWLDEHGDPAGAGRLLDLALSAAERHRTDVGMTTHAGVDGPRGKVCVKYNLLVLKLVVCSYVHGRRGELDAADVRRIGELFLIDR